MDLLNLELKEDTTIHQEAITEEAEDTTMILGLMVISITDHLQCKEEGIIIDNAK